MNKKKNFILILCAIIFVIMGIPFFISGVNSLYKTWYLDKKGVFTIGTVTYIETEYNTYTSDDKYQTKKTVTSYRPTIQFSTSLGLFEEKSSITSSSYKDFSIGDQVPIRYNENNPADYKIATSKAFLVSGIVFCIAGLFCFMVACILLRAFLKSESLKSTQ